jgi:hypothetical protein
LGALWALDRRVDVALASDLYLLLHYLPAVFFHHAQHSFDQTMFPLAAVLREQNFFSTRAAKEQKAFAR